MEQVLKGLDVTIRFDYINKVINIERDNTYYNKTNKLDFNLRLPISDITAIEITKPTLIEKGKISFVMKGKKILTKNGTDASLILFTKSETFYNAIKMTQKSNPNIFVYNQISNIDPAASALQEKKSLYYKMDERLKNLSDQNEITNGYLFSYMNDREDILILYDNYLMKIYGKTYGMNMPKETLEYINITSISLQTTSQTFEEYITFTYPGGHYASLTFYFPSALKKK